MADSDEVALEAETDINFEDQEEETVDTGTPAEDGAADEGTATATSEAADDPVCTRACGTLVLTVASGA